MEIPKLTIGSIEVPIPIIQGAMGVRVSLSSLASAVTNTGCIGTLSSIGLGDIENSKKNYESESRDAFVQEIRKTKVLTKGNFGVNIMGVLSNAEDLVKTAVREGIKIIVFGAGVPFRLPTLVEDTTVNLVPIISSARVVKIILKAWVKRHNRIPDAFILEGPKAGGHLGFTEEQLENIDDYSLEKILPQVLETLKPYEDQFGKKIPIIVGGGVYNGKDIADMLSRGASGVQMATRFVCTEECGVSEKFKQAYLDVKEEDITIIKSPVGMPGRAIYNKFLKDLEEKTISVKCPYKCLSTCNAKEAKYCIALALIKSYLGDLDDGLIFCGSNAHRITKIIKVQELITELVEEMKAL